MQILWPTRRTLESTTKEIRGRIAQTQMTPLNDFNDW
jgi:hypothetical protein